MLFGNKKLNDVLISINRENKTRVSQAKFLGVIIQSNLKWNAHITSIANKILKTIGVINKARHALDTRHLKMLYVSLIEPYLTYCCIVWANPVKILVSNCCISYRSTLSELYVLQDFVLTQYHCLNNLQY